jgi:response regulator RpfG family c-di-GMP phosphodiesterase
MKDDLKTVLKDKRRRDSDSAFDILKVLIVDDEPTVHDITALVLKNFSYRGFRLQLRSAYSASEAREILAEEGPFALILLDVIMETDDAGLMLAQYVREELRDPMVRIILRTGQPGMVPQRQVMREFEIDDYKEKAELTSERFDAAVTASIRTFLGFRRLEQNRQGLMRILDAIRNIESETDDENLADQILEQIESVMDRPKTSETGALLVLKDKETMRIVSGRGDYSEYQDCGLETLKNQDTARLIKESLDEGTTTHDSHHIMTNILTRDGGRYLAYFEDVREFGDMERYLIELYASHVNASLDNKMLTQELMDTQKEIISTLGEVIETRSGETGEHVQRVGEIARLLAESSGFTLANKELLLFAAPLHDIGKVGISDAILKKPAKLTQDEYERMKSHTSIGYKILKASKRPILKMGARICLEHHEWWNGGGYPSSLSGEEICMEARICAIADVLDALRSKRVYKDAVSLESALQIIKEGRGSQFDPNLVDILFEQRKSVEEIYSKFTA